MDIYYEKLFYELDVPNTLLWSLHHLLVIKNSFITSR